jgi:uncharacterized integral membrane protein
MANQTGNFGDPLTIIIISGCLMALLLIAGTVLLVRYRRRLNRSRTSAVTHKDRS